MHSKNSGHLKALSGQRQHNPKNMEDFTKSERVMSMFEFKKAIIEDEITEVIMRHFDHVAGH